VVKVKVVSGHAIETYNGEKRYSSMRSHLWHHMEVTGLLHKPATLFPAKSPWYLLNIRPIGLVWSFLRRKRYLTHIRDQAHQPVNNLVTIPSTLHTWMVFI